jgi:hypothetical protein
VNTWTRITSHSGEWVQGAGRPGPQAGHRLQVRGLAARPEAGAGRTLRAQDGWRLRVDGGSVEKLLLRLPLDILDEGRGRRRSRRFHVKRLGAGVGHLRLVEILALW